MRPALALALVLCLAVPAFALERMAARDSELGRKRLGPAPDPSLAGELPRPAPDVPVPADPVRRGVKAMVDAKRAEQIATLEQIIAASPAAERPALLFRLAELFREDGTPARAIDTYSELVQQHPSFTRMDEVLYFLGQALLDAGEDRRALIAYKRLIEKFPASKYVPDAHFAFGEHFFSTSKAKPELLERALGEYREAAKSTGAVAAWALYKQGWCHFNLGDAAQAMAVWEAVAPRLDEARADVVRAFARLPGGTAAQGRVRFARIAKTPEQLRTMNKQLAALYSADGKDKEAALAYDALIKEAPESKEAPGFQAKIVECVARTGNKRVTAQQVNRLAAMGGADPLAERILSNLAVAWHRECRSTRDDETCRLASEVYAGYLALFPENPKAYDLRFYWAELLFDHLGDPLRAAEQYSAVFTIDIQRGNACKVPGEPPCKRMPAAAYDAILAWDAAARATPRPTITDVTAKVEQPSLIRSLQGACDRYLKHLPAGDRFVEVEWLSAKTAYDYNDLDKAIARFTDIALNHCGYRFSNGDDAAELARHLVLDAYNLLNDCAQVARWSRAFLAQPQCVTGKGRDELGKLLEQAEFTCIAKRPPAKDCATAEKWADFVLEFPRSEIADKALSNAGTAFFACHRRERALESWKLLLHGYPKSPLVAPTTFALAEGHEQVADFEAAAGFYEQYAARFGQTPRAQIALFNAGVLREGLGQLGAAIADRERYLRQWPDAPDASQVFLSIADLYEREGKWARAVGHLEDFAGTDPSQRLAIDGRIARIQAEKLKNPRAARKVHDRVLAAHARLGPQVQLTPVALDAVARAHLARTEDDWQKYAKLKLKWSRLANTAELRRSIAEKSKALEGLQKRYTETIAFKSAEPAICALYKLGLAYDHFSDAMGHLPIPADAPAALRDELRGQVPPEADQLRARAREALMAAAQKGERFAADHPCRAAALEVLRTRYQVEQMREERPEMTLPPVPPRQEGGGLLKEITL